VVPLKGVYVYCVGVISSLCVSSFLLYISRRENEEKEVADEIEFWALPTTDQQFEVENDELDEISIENFSFQLDHSSSEDGDIRNMDSPSINNSITTRRFLLNIKKFLLPVRGGLSTCCSYFAMVLHSFPIHVVILGMLVASLVLPLFSVNKSIDIKVLEQHDTVHLNRTDSVISAAIAATTSQNGVGTGSASSPIISSLLMIFVVVAPLLKMISLLILWIGYIGCEWCSVDTTVRLRRTKGVLMAFWPWDMRDVFLLAVLILYMRVESMASSMSQYCHFVLTVDSAHHPGFTIMLFSVVIDYLMLLCWPKKLK